MPFQPELFLLLIIPLGVAGHNIGSGVVLFLWILSTWMRFLKKESFPDLVRLLRFYRLPLLTGLGYTISVLVASRLNDSLDMREVARKEVSYFFGHLLWLAMPMLVLLMNEGRWASWRSKRFLGVTACEWVDRCLALVAVLLGTAALSQLLVKWSVGGETPAFYRGRGFYSHPLTLAYVVLLLYPITLYEALKRWEQKPEDRSYWVLPVVATLGFGGALLASQSKTVLAAAFLVSLPFGWALMKRLPRRNKLGLILIGLVTGFALLKVSGNLSRVDDFIEKKDTVSTYGDDRLVFWKVHHTMFQEKPWLGHGQPIGTEYRRTYYEALGFTQFLKPYEAHNMYLQILVNGGLVGFSFFLMWMIWHLKWAWRVFHHKKGLFMSLCGFFLASITQNSFQDAEVRYVLSLVATWILIEARKEHGDGHEKLSAKSETHH